MERSGIAVRCSALLGNLLRPEMIEILFVFNGIATFFVEITGRKIHALSYNLTEFISVFHKPMLCSTHEFLSILFRSMIFVYSN